MDSKSRLWSLSLAKRPRPGVDFYPSSTICVTGGISVEIRGRRKYSDSGFMKFNALFQG